MIRLTKEVSLHKNVEAFELTPDICLAHLVITENETIIYDTYIFCKPDKIDELLDNINYKEDIFFKNLKFLHKDFIEDYKYSATPYKLEYFIDKYGINKEALWQALTSEILILIITKLLKYVMIIIPFIHSHMEKQSMVGIHIW